MRGVIILFQLKHIGIASVAAASIIGGAVTIANESKKSKINALVTAININNLPGEFIRIRSYEPLEYYIDESVFNQELRSYLYGVNPAIKYSYKVKGNDVKITYKYKGKNKTKLYHLQKND